MTYSIGMRTVIYIGLLAIADVLDGDGKKIESLAPLYGTILAVAVMADVIEFFRKPKRS